MSLPSVNETSAKSVQINSPVIVFLRLPRFLSRNAPKAYNIASSLSLVVAGGGAGVEVDMQEEGSDGKGAGVCS